jgi:hypothetical protein
MPTGYPGMMLFSLIPPLWFAFMNRKLDEMSQNTERERRGNSSKFFSVNKEPFS